MADNPSPFALQLQKARDVIAALVPRVAEAQRFRAVKGSRRIEDEPSTADRLFEVRAEDAPAISGSEFGSFLVDAKRAFIVRVRYDAKHHFTDLDARIATDDDQIRTALQAGTNRVLPFVRIIRLTGGDQSSDRDAVIRSLTFECTYRYAP